MRVDSARQYCSDQKKIVQITATLQVPNPAKGLVEVQIRAAIRAAQQAAGQCPVPFLALQILRVRQQNIGLRQPKVFGHSLQLEYVSGGNRLIPEVRLIQLQDFIHPGILVILRIHAHHFLFRCTLC